MPDSLPAFAPLETERFRLRPLRPADAAEMHRLVNDWEVAKTLARVPFPYPRDLADEWIASTAERIAAGEAYHLAIARREDDVLVGCALIQKDGEGSYFGMFAIEPALQIAGLGKALLAKCERAARDLWAAKWMSMVVISVREELIAWYERRGYVRTGHREPFPFSPSSGETTRDFDLVELKKSFEEQA